MSLKVMTVSREYEEGQRYVRKPEMRPQLSICIGIALNREICELMKQD